MDAELSCMSFAEISQSIQTTQLELAYERTLRDADRIYEEERARGMRVQLLLLEHENDGLQEEAESGEDQQHHLRETNEELQGRLAEVEADLQQAQMDLKARLRDLEYLRTEVNALSAASSDASKLLAEKLALSRELNTLKPELEHLRSQSSSYQKLLSEKLALQRELSSLQVELETEKRAVQRLKSQEKSSNREDSELAEEIDSLRRELAKLQRDAQKNERESRKRTTEWENEKEVLEGKLDAFRNKVRSTKEQLKDAQEEIERLQAAQMAQSTEMTKARLNGVATTANARKRNVARFDPDMTIGTPGNGGPAAKKPRISVNVGDKSNFSITPFLNRTLSILPETPPEEEGQRQKEQNTNVTEQVDGLDEDEDVAPKAQPVRKKQTTAKRSTAPAVKRKGAQPLKETTNSKANGIVKTSRPDKIIEEESDMESDQGVIVATEAQKTSKEDTERTRNADPTAEEATQSEPPRKQKAATKRANIFDEDSAPAPKIRSLAGGLAGKGGVLGRINLKAKAMGKGKTLAEFSPLKRDRRAVSVIE
ncbi:uncharacterized protein A1O5_00953 [Cladophialophora psammophila CBS 110553]|uniref:Uncharacterized protein n=1 Tax=Cladophialophora psammophila CBS 110553 TaxID=1182543 RepID=W9XGI4_9EURO|nr:uncharacterized protein A1O5_00953 [Cladophialophora psammophila CBS 110553]EXJ76445.1 hypothetical protein A1O5_00953 [Cladophialophora psammophila CBS 110553]